MTVVYDAERSSESLLSRRDSRWRLAALVLAMVGTACLQSPPTIGAALCFSLVLLVISKLPWRVLVSRVLMFGLFLAPFLVVLPLLRGWDGVVSSGRIAGRATALFGLALVLLTSCPFAQTVQAAQTLGAPIVLTRIVLMSYRYVHVLGEELARLRIAVRVRGFRNRANVHSYRTIGLAAGTLLVRGAERAERVAYAMHCRGFDGQLRQIVEWRTRIGDVVLFLAIVGSAVTLVAWDYCIRD